MEILFLSHSYKMIHHSLVNEITACLERNNHNVSGVLDKSVTYDCIIIFNKKELKNHRKDFDVMKTPVIYLFCISDVIEEYPVLEHVTKIIAFKDKILNIRNLPLISVIYQEMILPADYLNNVAELDIRKQSTPNNQNDKRLIYINIDDDNFGGMTFLKLLSLLNRLQEYDIHYQSKKRISRQFINKHIKLINSKKDIAECINRADIVIASGYAAYLSVQLGKKTIVVGEKGYGGVVMEENLEYHMGNFFQGRNGGKFDEHIPYPLMAKAIETDITNTRKIQDKLSYLQNINQKRFVQLIEFIATCVNNEETNLTTSYIFNWDYDLIKMNKRIWLCKRGFTKMYKSVNESEGAVINAFQKPNTIHEVLNVFPAEYEDIIKEYIYELVAKKILIPTAISGIKIS